MARNELKNRIRFFVNIQKTRIDEGRGASRLYAAKIRELKEQLNNVRKRGTAKVTTWGVVLPPFHCPASKL